MNIKVAAFIVSEKSSYTCVKQVRYNYQYTPKDMNQLMQLRYLYRWSNMRTHVLLKLLNELRKRDKRRGLPSILSLFRNEFNKFNNTTARMLDFLSYDINNTLKSHYCRRNVIIMKYLSIFLIFFVC